MRRNCLILMLLCLVMTTNACNRNENDINNENVVSDETEMLDTEILIEELEAKFIEKLCEHTDEKVAAIAVDDFMNTNQYSAFIVTVPNQYNLPEENAEIYEYFITSSLWYVDELACVNVYQNNDKGSILLVSGMLKNGTCCASVGQMSAYAPEVNYNTSYYMVEDSQPVYLFTTASSVINEKGYIETTEVFWEEERRIKHCIYECIDKELVFINEIYVE